ncbi:CHASE2 domain-containing protein [Microseira sp. BLCC-F43]|uniref:CHASE2 domain-containing protein n=1 Tax=Microseira sp. BLCC-F43 TaxID=3153602 RepID=UPI0035B934EE
MADERTLTLTSSNASAKSSAAANPITGGTRQYSRLARLGHILTGACALAAAIATAANTNLVRLMEYQAQMLFFELRGPVEAPENIVILAIDNESLKQADIYLSAPQQYAYLEPIQTWPWKRAAYAKAIDKIMAAGARSVAVDVVFDRPSKYGEADDQQLRQTLQRYAGKVTLGAIYEDIQSNQGTVNQLTQPLAQFLTQPFSVGSINFPLEADGRIHRLGSEYRKLLEQTYKKQLVDEFKHLSVATPSFGEAALTASGLNYAKPKGDRIHFWGPSGTFKQIPFWYVLDPINWNGYLQQGSYFKDKIVLIGPTATELKDFHKAPFSQSWLYPDPLAGVEIHANAIATLLQGKTLQEILPHTPLKGLFVLLFSVGAGWWLSKRKRSLNLCGWTVGIVVAWSGIGYIAFVYGGLIVPVAVPVFAIALSGVSYLTTGVAISQLKKHDLRKRLESNATLPEVRDILDTLDDLNPLPVQSKAPVTIKSQSAQLNSVPAPINSIPATNNKIIGFRYEIVRVLGQGGFGETYIACDIQRPGKPRCVVKQLKPAFKDAKHMKLARRLFATEAEVLEKVGQHAQIPQLLAYFEENEQFYLVQECIDGHPLDEELLIGRQLPESIAINMLQEILQILEFVHGQGVIHRDIKPSNIIRREKDGKLVLIDFGAVKEINTQLLENERQSRFTVGIGTQGYAPSEQCAGRPRFNSDIYAVGMMGIQALTGLPPHQLVQDPETGEILWTSKAQVSEELAEVISKMVRYDFRQRYQTASEAREALLKLTNFSHESVTQADDMIDNSDPENIDDFTKPWSDRQEEEDEATKPWTGMPQEEEDEATKPWTGMPQEEDEATKPWTGMPQEEAEEQVSTRAEE